MRASCVFTLSMSKRVLGVYEDDKYPTTSLVFDPPKASQNDANMEPRGRPNATQGGPNVTCASLSPKSFEIMINSVVHVDVTRASNAA